MSVANENLVTLLKQIAASQNYQNCDLKVTAVCTGGANFSSQLYRVRIASDGRVDLNLFAKVAAVSEKMREQSNLQFYDNERFLYTVLLKAFRELEETRRLSEEQKLRLPKYYGADATHLQEIIVLEDLASRGFVLHNRLEPVSWQYASAALTELAKFHALSLAYQHHNPSGFNELIGKTFRQGMFTDHEGNQLFYKNSVKSALAAVHEKNKEKFKTFLKGRSLSQFSSMYGAVRRPVLIHADFRPSNMLHKLRNDGTVEVIVVDYQTLQGGCPVIDLLFFIFTATDGQFRSRHYELLVNYYHSELGAALARLGLDVEDTYSREDFEFELKERLPYGLLVSVLMLPILLVEENVAPQLGEDLDMASMGDLPAGSLYTQRMNEVVDDYVAWGVLK